MGSGGGAVGGSVGRGKVGDGGGGGRVGKGVEVAVGGIDVAVGREVLEGTTVKVDVSVNGGGFSPCEGDVGLLSKTGTRVLVGVRVNVMVGVGDGGT